MKQSGRASIRMPRILFQSRQTLFSVPGGDTIQIQKTAEHLKALGCTVDISTELSPDLRGYDLVHLFNLTRPQETFLQALNARKQSRPIVLSPIYVDYREFDRKSRKGLGGLMVRHLPSGLTEYIKIAGRAVANQEVNRGTIHLLCRGYNHVQTRLLALCNLLLPNSESEMRRIERDFKSARSIQYQVVPNAVDAKLFDASRPLPALDSRFTGCVLCVARIEGRKCQLELVRALKNADLKLVLIGAPAPNHLSYYKSVKSAMGSNTELISHIDHSDLPAYYAAAKVHALVSWMETTGLSSLEAAAMGANIVVTDKGDTRDYFGEHAFYCDPSSIESIRRAVMEALHAPHASLLQARVRDHYTWDRAAEESLNAYEKCLTMQVGPEVR